MCVDIKMFSKDFILSVGLSLCSTILIYLYVKSRINSLENSVKSLMQIIQSYGQNSQPQQQVAGHDSTYEKIMVSEDEEESSDEEDDSDEEENEDDGLELQQEIVHENTVDEDATSVQEEGVNEIISLSSHHVLHDMVETHVLDNEDGLDEMDDLDEDLEEEEETHEIDYESMGKLKLKEICQTKGFDVKGKKKHELLELLK
jgi:hypothetical protein